MRLFRFLSLAFCLACCVACLRPLSAQTYNPKTIRFEGGGDPAELLRLTGLQPGTPLTKADIEAAMGKLADTGAFTDLSYTVNAQALVIKLGGAGVAGRQARPVRYVNLVWWQPDELTRLLEQRVPLFHGDLPLAGSLTDQVRAALVQLLAEKGVPNARVDAMPSTTPDTHVAAIALQVMQPEILLGSVALAGAAPVTQKQLDTVTRALGMQEFETDLSAIEIRDNVGDTEKNAGYLDATVDPPTYSAPRKDMNGYAIDASATVHPGELYRIGTLDLQAKPPLSLAEAEKATDLKPGQVAGALAMTIGQGKLQRAYDDRGYLDAKVTLQTTLDSTAHTVTAHFAIEPGELYHLAGVDTTSLPADLQASFARDFRGRPGMEAGSPLTQEVFKALSAMGATHTVQPTLRNNRADHTVTVVLTPARTRLQPTGQRCGPSCLGRSRLKRVAEKLLVFVWGLTYEGVCAVSMSSRWVCSVM